MKSIPNLSVSPEIRSYKSYDPDAEHLFHYEAKGQESLPHVVKFSGGRSSGMLLLILLEAGILKAARGDVIVFNNTSAEHPETYAFTKKFKEMVEKDYKIPFFWIESQSYEDARNGIWTRLFSYRMVKPEPHSENNPDGYHWRGEVFEEMLSWKGYVPNQFSRVCTVSLKLEATRAFLRDWISNKPGTEQLGHSGDESRLDDEDLYKRHRKSQGDVPKDIFLEKKEFVRGRALARPAQQFSDFSSATVPFENKILEERRLSGRAYFGRDGVEYISFIGIRYDEMHRVVKIRRRNSGETEAGGYEGEYVYMPLSSMGITKENVNDFWHKQPWNLNLDAEDGLSNCTYCFLKGAGRLHKVRSKLQETLPNQWTQTPADINWWVSMEKKYGRDLAAEKRKIRKDGVKFIGFFGSHNKFSYELLANNSSRDRVVLQSADSFLPCDCTD